MPKAKSKPTALATWVNDVKVFWASFNYQDKDWLETDQLKKDIKAHLAQSPGAGLTLDLFNRVALWKLERQKGRNLHWRQKNTDDLVRKVTSCAFSLVHSERETLARTRLGVVGGLPGVDIGVASAILTLTFPDEYGVIDPRIWMAIYGVKKSGFTLRNYTGYLEDLLSAASFLGWPPQEVDFFAWKKP